MTEERFNCAYDELVDIDKLVPNPKNNNKHPKEQIERLAKIIDFQGQRKAIVVSNRSGFIVKGHGCLEAIKKLGWKKVAVDYQDYESDAQEYADMTADNEIARWATLDTQMVLDELPNLDIDTDLLGMIEIPDLEKEENTEVVEDDVPEQVETRSKRGDICQLGEHRLMCGDSTCITDVEKLMDGEKADMVFTDPPYNVAFNGRSGNFDVIKNDNLSENDFSNFINDTVNTIKFINAPIYYIWCNWKFYGILHEKLEYKSCIVWAKNVFGLGKGYRHQHEFCLFNGSIDENITNETDLWQIAKDVNYVHPTQKPVSLCARALGNHKKVKSVVDLFGGSGSTLIACEQLNRKCFTMELDEHYCDVIIQRWENLTGNKASLINGESKCPLLKTIRLNPKFI